MDGNYQNNRFDVNKIRDWVFKSVDNVNATGNASDVHVDNFIDVSDLRVADLVRSSIELFYLFTKPFGEKGSNALVIYLSIELTEGGKELKGAPTDFKNLCREFDKFSMPEIILYKPAPLIYPPLVEIYRKPLFFKGLDYPSMTFFYKEDRPISIPDEGLEFRRELNVMYIP